MRSFIRTAAALLSAAFLTGCPKTESDTSSQGKGGEPGLGAHVQRGKEKRSLENDIRQLATFMKAYETENGSPPKSWQDFKPYIQREAGHIVREIDAGQINVLWGAPMNSNTIVAYEVEPDIRNSHVVAKGDGSVVTLPSDQLQAALRAQGVGR
jgi:hypothetical protein